MIEPRRREEREGRNRKNNDEIVTQIIESVVNLDQTDVWRKLEEVQTSDSRNTGDD
jgi:hypothetical protein